MIIENTLKKKIEYYIKYQNMQLLKLIAETEGWNYKELCLKYLQTN